MIIKCFSLKSGWLVDIFWFQAICSLIVIHCLRVEIFSYFYTEYSDNDNDDRNKRNEINLTFLITLENELLSFMKYLSRLTKVMLDYHRTVHKLTQFQNSLSLLDSRLSLEENKEKSQDSSLELFNILYKQQWKYWHHNQIQCSIMSLTNDNRFLIRTINLYLFDTRV
jgi:hypothetical protein